MRIDNSLRVFWTFPVAGRLPVAEHEIRGLRNIVFLITDFHESEYWKWYQSWRDRYEAGMSPR